MGAKWRAIVGRRRATKSLLKRSIFSNYQQFSYSNRLAVSRSHRGVKISIPPFRCWNRPVPSAIGNSEFKRY